LGEKVVALENEIIKIHKEKRLLESETNRYHKLYDECETQFTRLKEDHEKAKYQRKEEILGLQ
jgi:hypothetical protein